MRYINHWINTVAMIGILSGANALAAQKTIDIYKVNNTAENDGIGDKIGSITFEDGSKGLIIRPSLSGLPEGAHGFHIHEKPSCERAQKKGVFEAAEGAGGHLDPQHTERHLGPSGKGHLGDLPVLSVDKHGVAEKEKIAPHLTLAAIDNHSIIIHQDGDNYSDVPKPMGGGDGRIACGVIK